MPAFSFEGKEIPVNPYLSPCASSTHFDTGDTAFTFPVGKGMEYQNRGTGVMLGPDGCVYVPTRNHIVALCEKSSQGDADDSIS